MTALDGYGDFDTKRLSSKPVNTILDKTEVFYMFAFRGKWAPNLVLVPLNSVPGLGRATTRKWAIQCESVEYSTDPVERKDRPLGSLKYTFLLGERILTTLCPYQLFPGGSSRPALSPPSPCHFYHARKKGKTALANKNLFEQTRVEHIDELYFHFQGIFP